MRAPKKKKPAMMNVKIKHLNSLSYMDLVRSIGPLTNFNTVIGERKNGVMKNVVIRRRNYNNIVKTLGDFVDHDEVADESTVRQ